MKATIKNQNDTKEVSMYCKGSIDNIQIGEFVNKILVPNIFNKVDKIGDLIEKKGINGTDEGNNLLTFTIEIDYIDESNFTQKLLNHLAKNYEDGFQPIFIVK